MINFIYKILLILSISFVSLFSGGMIGGIPDNNDEDAQTILAGFLNEETWYYNLYNPDTKKYKNNINENEIINFDKKLIDILKDESLLDELINEPTDTGFNKLRLYRIYKENVNSLETINKLSSNNLLNNSMEQTFISLDKKDYSNSYLLGSIDKNLGLASGFTINKFITKIKEYNIVIIDITKINFKNVFLKSYKNFCASNPDGYFPFIWNPFLFLQTYGSFEETTGILEKLKNGLDVNDNTGLLQISCNIFIKNGSEVDDYFHDLKELKIFLNDEDKSYFTSKVNYNFSEMDKYYDSLFSRDGLILKYPSLSGREIEDLANGFFSYIMDTEKIELGGVIISNDVDIETKDWKVGKCPTYYHKKSLKESVNYYSLNSTVLELPFEEMNSMFMNTPSKNIITYTPLSPLPDTTSDNFFYVTSDKHTSNVSLSDKNLLIEKIKQDDIDSGNLEIKDDFLIINTSSKKSKCGFGGLLGILLIVVAVVITVFTLGAGAPILGMTVAAAEAVGLALAAIVVVTGLIMLDKLDIKPPSINVGVTPITGSELYDKSISNDIAKNNGSFIYSKIINIENTLSNVDNINYKIDSFKYRAIKENSRTVNLGENDASDDKKPFEYAEMDPDNVGDEKINKLLYITKEHANPKTFGLEFYTFNSMADENTIDFSGSSENSCDDGVTYENIKDTEVLGLNANISLGEYVIIRENNMLGKTNLGPFSTKVILLGIINELYPKNLIKY